MQGGITVTNEPLVLQGQGSNLEPTVQTFTIGGATTGNYNLTFNGASTTPGSVSYASTTAQVQSALQSLVSVGQAGGQISVMETGLSGGLTDEQQISFDSNWNASGGKFRLKFGPTPSDPNVYTTPDITYTGNYITDEVNISLALDSLPNVGLFGAHASVSGSSSSASSGETFTVTFIGALADVPALPTLVATNSTNPANTPDTPTITHLRYGALPTKVYRAVFLGSFAGTSEPTMTSTSSGGTIVFPPSTLITGGSANATPDQWFSTSQGTVLAVTQTSTFASGSTTVTVADATRLSVGMTVAGTGIPAGTTITAINVGAPTQTTITISNATTAVGTNLSLLFTGSTAITNARPYNGASTVAENMSGPVTDVVVDPTNPNMIYIATASGGAWRTQDGGISWQPLFDAQFNLANPAVMFGGQIAIDPRLVGNIYYATGVDANSGKSYYGSGVYLSTNFGETWTLLTDSVNGNPFVGMSISAIITNPYQDDSVVVTANYSSTYGNVNGLANPATDNHAGVWFYQKGSWTQELFNNPTTNGVITSGSMTVTGIDTTQLVVGMLVTGAGIPAGTTITAIPVVGSSGSPGTITLSNNATASGTVALTFGFTKTGSLSGQGVAGVTVTYGGSGYASPPTITFSGGGGGSGAAATANLTNGVVTSVTITNPGSGYTSAPTVTFSAPAGVSTTGDVTSGNPNILNLATVAGLVVGMTVGGTGITPGTTIISIGPGNQVRLSANATASGVGVSLTFAGTTATGIASVVGGLNVIGGIDTTGLVVGMTVTENFPGITIPADTTIIALTANTVTLSATPTLASGVTLPQTFPWSFWYHPQASYTSDNFSSLVYDPGQNNPWDSQKGVLMVGIGSTAGSADLGVLTTPAGTDFFTNAANPSGPQIWKDTNNFNTVAQTTPNGGSIMLAGNTYEASGQQFTGSTTSTYDAYYAAVTTNGNSLFDVQWLQLASNPPAPNPLVTSWTDRADTGPPTITTSPISNLSNNYLASAGSYANAITAYGNYVFIGGTDPGSGVKFLYMSSNNGATWSDIVAGAAAGPSTAIRSMQAFSLNANATPTTLYVATDGGIWTYTIATAKWTDITGNLADAEFISASASATNPYVSLAAGNSVGVVYSNISAVGAQNWIQTSGVGESGYANGTDAFAGPVTYSPVTGGLAYYIQYNNPDILFKSTNANTSNPTWTNIGTASYFALDPNNPNRIVVISGGITDINTNISTSAGSPGGFAPTMVALPGIQGQYQADPGFPSITASPSNTSDTQTFYAANATNIAVTKNHGATPWVTRTPSTANGANINIGGTNTLTISDIIVDPTDRDTIYAVASGSSGTAGVGHVFKSTNAGQTWTDLTGAAGGLADVSVWTIALDARSGDLYVGTDTGVYKLAGGVLSGGNNWVRFGSGLPFVQVRDIELNTNANVLTIATYGRGVYQYFLSDPQPEAGALRALSGQDQWNGGQITLLGPTTIGVNGSSYTSASLTINAVIADATTNAVGNTLTKIGGGDLTLGGANTYAGVTLVSEGQVITTNPNALGSAGVAGTQVLFLQNAVANITQFTLSYISNSPTSTATIAYTGVGGGSTATPANVGTGDPGTILTALSAGGFLPAGVTVSSVTADATDTMFTIVLAFSGTPTVQPLFTVKVTQGTGGGFSAEAGSTWIVSGTDLQLQSSLNLEPITLNGDGVQPPSGGHNTGALIGGSGNFVYTGTITLNTNSTIGVGNNNTGGTLTINPASPLIGIIDGGTPQTKYSLTKEGSGTLVLASTDTYQGNTYVDTGVLQVANNAALGTNTSTIVSDGAQVQLKGGVTVPTTDSLYLTGFGIGTADTTAGALRNVSGNNTWTGNIFLSSLPYFSTSSGPGGVVPIYVQASTTLTLSGVIAEGLPPTPANAQASSGTPAASGLAEVGTGTLVLNPLNPATGNPSANTYSGGTYVGYTFNTSNINGVNTAGVPGGTIDVQNANALGTDLGNNEIQRLVTYDPPGASDTYTLSFTNVVTGVTSTTANIASGATPGAVQNALNAAGMTAISLAITGTTGVGSALVTNLGGGLTSASQLAIGMPVYGANLTNAITGIQSATWSGNVATITLAANGNATTAGTPWFTAGQKLTIAGVGAPYNGVFTILSSTTSSITYALPQAVAPGSVGVTAGATLIDTDAAYTIVAFNGTTSITLNTGIGVTTGASVALRLGGVAVTGATVYSGLSEVQTVSLTNPTSPLNNVSTLTATAASTAGGNLNPSMIIKGTTNGTTTVTLITVSNLYVGESVSGTGITAGTTITAINTAANQITLSQTAVAGTNPLTFTQAYYYEVTAVTPLGESLVNSNGQQTVNTPATVVITGNTSAVTNQNRITNLTATANLSPGMLVSGPGIPAGTTITAITVAGSPGTITISNNATATGANQTLTFTPAVVVTGNTSTVTNPNQITNLSSTANLLPGMLVSGPGIPAGTSIVSILVAGSPGTILISNNATATGASQTLTFITNPAASLSWGAVSGATSYKIYRSLNSGDFAQALLTKVSAPTTTYSDVGLVSIGVPVVSAALDAVATGTLQSIPYFYVVTAVGVAGETLPGTEVTATPTANQDIDLSWSAIPGAISYNVYRTTTSGSYTGTNLLASTTLPYFQDASSAAPSNGAPPSDSFAPPALLNANLATGGALTPNTTYYYAVSSTGPNGESTINTYSSVTTSAANLGMLRVNLTWTAENDATGYRIYRSTTPITQANLSNDLIAVLTSGTTASYADLGATFTVQGTTSNGSPTVTNLASTNLLTPGMSVTGPGITGAYILSVDSASQITLSANATTAAGAGTGTLSFTGVTGFTPPTQTYFSLNFNLGFAGTTSNSTSFALTGANAAANAALLARYVAAAGSNTIVVSGTGIQANTTIVSVNTVTNTVVLSLPAEATGSPTLTFGSPMIAYTGNAVTDAANLQSALQAMPTIGAGNVAVTADPSDTIFTVSFQNALSNVVQNLIGAVITQSTAGISTAEQTPGDGGASYVYNITFLGGAALTPKIAQNLIQITKTGSLIANTFTSEVATGGFGTLVYTNSTLKLDGDPTGIGSTLTMPAGTIVALNGNGEGGTGALFNGSGYNNTWPSTIILQSSSNISAAPNTQLTVTGTISDDPYPLVLSPVPLSTPASLTFGSKVGATTNNGTVVLNPAASAGNTYTGSTFANYGVLNIQTAHALGYNVSDVEDVNVTGSSGSFMLNYNGGLFTPSINVGANALTVQNALNNLANLKVGGGSVYVTKLDTHYYVYFNNPFGALGSDPLAYVSQSGSLGTQFSNGANVVISTKLLGGGSTTNVASGGTGPATLQLQNAAIAGGNNGSLMESSGKTLNLNGAGFNGNGALENILGSNTWGTSGIILNTNSTIGVDDTSSLNISQAISESSPGSSLTQVGPGTLQFLGTASNTYTGLTSVTDGTLLLSKINGATAVAGNLAVGEVTDDPRLTAAATYLQQSQTITLNNLAQGQNYKLVFAGQATSSLTYQGGNNSDVIAIMGALNSLPFVTSATNGTNTLTSPITVTLTGTTATSSTFKVTFNGSTNAFAGIAWGQIIGFPSSVAAGQSITGSMTNISQTGPLTLPSLQKLPLVTLLAGSTNEIATTSTITADDFGEFFMDTASQQTIAGLNMTAGYVYLNGAATTLTLGGSAALNASSDTQVGKAFINGGILSLGNSPGNTHLFTVTRGAGVTGAIASRDLEIDSLLTDSNYGAANVAFTKAGNGRLELNNAETYQGETIVTAGDLQVDTQKTQTITLPATITASNTFSLTYTNPSVNSSTISSSPITTALITYSVTPATTAQRIQDALNNALVGSTTGPVTVTSINGLTFVLLFGVFPIGGADSSANLVPLGVASYNGSGGTAAITVASKNTIPGEVILSGGSLSGTGTVGTVSATAVAGPVSPLSLTGSTTANNAQITVSSTTALVPGMFVSGGSIPAGATIVSVDSATQVTLSGNTAGIVTASPVAFTFTPTAVINPGANGPGAATNSTGVGTGILQTNGDVTLTSNTGFVVDLVNSSNSHPPSGKPIVGSDYDQLYVNGNVTLGGALLTGTVGTNVAIGDSFTIVQATGTVSGQFSEMIAGVQTLIGPAPDLTDSLFIGNKKFLVTYNAHTVVLTRALITDTVIVTPLANPIYGQNVTYTATVVPELGAPTPNFATDGSQITFTDTATTQTLTTNVVNGVATFTPQTSATSTPAGSLWATGSLHSITAAYLQGSLLYANESYPATLVGTTTTSSPVVALANTAGLIVGTSVSGPGIPANTLIASVDTATQITLSQNVTTGFTNLAIDFGPQSAMPGNTTNNSAVITGLFSTSPFAIGMSVSGTGIPAGDSILSIDSGTQITLAHNATANGSNVTLTFGPVYAITMPANTTNNNKVVTNLPSTNQLVAGMAVSGTGIPASTFIASVDSATQITLTQNATATATDVSLTFVQVVQKQNVSIVSTLPATSIYGQPLSFTATVSASVTPNVPGAVQPDVTQLTISIDGGAPQAAASVSGQIATFNLPTTLNVNSSPHTITISFGGDTNYNANSTAPTINILPDKTTIAITPVPAISSVGQPVTFGIQVSPFTQPSFGNPAEGTVSVYDGNPTLASTTTTATFVIPSLLTAAFPISVTTTAGMAAGQYLYISSGPNSIVATVTSVVNGTTVNIQALTIVSGSAGNIMASSATVALTSLLDAPNNTNASFVIPSIGNSTSINFASTTWITTGQFLNISDGPHTIIAQVTSVGTGIVTIQTVAIVTGTAGNTMASSAAVALATDPSSGASSFTTSSLAFGTHQIYAVFNDTDGNYTGGTANDASIPYTIQASTTITNLTANPAVPPGSDVFGQTVTLTATVTSTQGIPTAGRVDFYDGVVTNTSSPNYLGSASIVLTSTSIMAASWNANTATITAANSFVVGQTVLVTGVTPTAYDGTFTIVSATSTNFTYALPLGVSPGAGTAFGTASIGQAILPTNVLAVGNHTISAQYNDVLPDQNYAQSPTVTITGYVVSQANSKVTVTASASNVQSYGNALTFTATITAVAPGSDPSPTGTVTFSDSLAGSLGAGTFVAPNTWIFTTTATQFVVGSHTITATYSGDTNLTGSNLVGPNPGTLTSYVITPASTTVSTPTATWSNSPTTPVYGQAITLSATVTGNAPGTPGNPTTGTVTFKDGATTLGVVDLSTLGSNVATLVTSPPPASQMSASATPHSITATYAPAASSNFSGNVSTALSQTVNPANTVFNQLTSSPSNPSGVGQTVTYTATVATVSPSTALVTSGTVKFFDNGVLIGSAANVSASGVATVTMAYTAAGQAGTHVITATYVPPVVAPINYNGSSTTVSTQLTQTVLKGSAVSVAAVSNTWGQSLIYTVKVTSLQGGNPSGTVTVTEAGNAVPGANVGTLSVISGVSTTTITIPANTLAAGSHSLVFTYTDTTVPTAVYATNTATITQPVASAATTIALTSSIPGTSEFAQAVTFTATLKVTSTTPAGTPGYPPSGTVTFTDGTTTLQVVDLASVAPPSVTITPGAPYILVVTYKPASLSQASHTIKAVYSGSAPATPTTENFAASNTASLTQVVAAQGSLGALATAATAWTQGQAYSTTIVYTRGGTSSAASSVSVSPGSLPTGLNVVVTNATTLTISGTPSVAGPYTFTLNVTDAAGVTVNRAYTVTINAVPSLAPSSGALTGGFYKTPLTDSVTITGGTAPFTLVSAVTGLPAGVTASIVGNQIKFSGTPTAVGSFNSIVVKVKDASGVTLNATYSLTIQPATVTITTPVDTVAAPSAAATPLVGTAVTFTTVISSPAGKPTGTVTFYDAASGSPVSIGNGTVIASTTTSATYRLISTAVTATRGEHTITAQYNGSASGSPATNLFAATAPSAPLTINVVNTVVTVSASPKIITPKNTVTFTALVTSPNTTNNNVTYTVDFYDNGTLLGTGTAKVVNGKATVTLVVLPANHTWTIGTHSITALFNGDSAFDSVLSTPLAFVVQASGGQVQ